MPNNTPEFISVKVKISIGEHTRGKVYNGVLEVGKKKFFWLLVFTVAISDMNKEMEAREKRGQNLRSPEVKKELFTLVILNEEWRNVSWEDSGFDLLQEFVSRAANFHDAPISDVWSQISGGTCSSPFAVEEGFEVAKKDLPAFLR